MPALAAILTLVLGAPATADAEADLRDELAQMRADLAAIRAQQRDGWMDQARADQIRGIVEDVLADSATRASLQGATDGAVCGYQRGVGFFVGTPDGSFRLEIFGFTQQRFVYNAGYDAAERAPYGVDSVWGFESRRNELFLNGNILDKSLQYLVGFSYDQHTDPEYMPSANGNPGVATGAQLGISYLNLTKQLADGWFVQVGSIFTPWTYQSHLFAAQNTQMGEYSPLEFLFGAAYTTGVNVGVANEQIIWQLCWGDAIGLAPSGWNADSNQSGAVATRLNWKLAGNWDEYANETSFPGDPFGAFIGVAARWQNGRAINPVAAQTAGQWGLTADINLMFGGANLIAQGVYIADYVSSRAGAWGALVQGGFFVSDSVELFANWTIANAVGTQSVANLGGNWYIDRASLKVTARAMVPTSGNFGTFYAAFLPAQGLLDAAAPNNTVSFVLQLQMAF